MGATSVDERPARGMSGTATRIAERFVRIVREAPPGRLERMMRAPLRRFVLGGIFWQMPKHLDPERASGANWSVRWCITGRDDGGADIYQLEIADGRGRVIRGASAGEPRVTITVDGVQFLKLATGNSDPVQAYFTGKIELAGDIMLAAKLASVFRIPTGPTVSRRST